MKLFTTTKRYVAVVRYTPEIVYCAFYKRRLPFFYQLAVNDFWATDDFGYMYRYFTALNYGFIEAVASVISPVAGDKIEHIHIIFSLVKAEALENTLDE